MSDFAKYLDFNANQKMFNALNEKKTEIFYV